MRREDNAVITVKEIRNMKVKSKGKVVPALFFN
jgi:hypothetical protein